MLIGRATDVHPYELEDVAVGVLYAAVVEEPHIHRLPNVGRKLCRIAVAVYGAATMTGANPDVLDSYPWVAPDEELNHLASVRWLKNRGHWSRVSLFASSLHTLALAVANGLGFGVLPCYLADGDPRLVRLGVPIDELSGDLWFLTHSELRYTARMRALSDFLAREFHALRPLFQGETVQ